MTHPPIVPENTRAPKTMRAAVLLALAAATAWASKTGDGFGEGYGWAESLEAGTALAAREGKPLMVVVSKSWCGACKALKPLFAASREIASEAPNVVMVSLADDEEPKGDKYAPAGASYIPRIMFYSPSGRLLPATAPNKDYAYYYSNPIDVWAQMRQAVEMSVHEGLAGVHRAADNADDARVEL